MIRESLREDLSGTLKKISKGAGSEARRDLILSEAVECVHLMSRYGQSHDDNKLGQSRIGGFPDLPGGVEWPTEVDDQGHPSGYAQFLAQFNLADIPEFDGSPVPHTGFLWLFSRRSQDAFDIPCVAIYESKAVDLERRTLPTKFHVGRRSFGPMPVDFKLGISLPLYRTSFRKALGLDCDYIWRQEILKLLRTPIKSGRESVGQVGGFSILEEYDLYRWIAISKMGHGMDHYRASEFASLSEYEQALKDMARNRVKFRVKFSEHSEIERFLPLEWLSSLRSKVEWADQHRAEIEMETASWRMLVSFWGTLQVDVGLGEALSLDIFARSSDLQSMNFETLIGEMPQVL